MKILLILLGLSVVVLTADIIRYYSHLFSSRNAPTASPSPNQTKTVPKEEMTFIFAGDAMFGRAIYAQFYDDLRDAFQNLRPDFFKDKDIAMLNLEGPMVQNEFVPDTNPNNLIMKFPPQTAETLKWLNINAAGLANNHTANQGDLGLMFTREILAKNQITTVGDPHNTGDLVKTFSKKNLKVSLIAVNLLANIPDLAALIKDQKATGALVIVFPHWGAEYETTHNALQERLAHEWIEAGADMVIGSHPHVIQDAEIYQKRPIFYSLGNFLFDQTFSQNTQRGLVVAGKITDQKLFLELLPIKSVRLKVEAMTGQEKEAIVGQIKKELGFESGSEIVINLE